MGTQWENTNLKTLILTIEYLNRYYYYENVETKYICNNIFVREESKQNL